MWLCDINERFVKVKRADKSLGVYFYNSRCRDVTHHTRIWKDAKQKAKTQFWLLGVRYDVTDYTRACHRYINYNLAKLN